MSWAVVNQIALTNDSDAYLANLLRYQLHQSRRHSRRTAHEEHVSVLTGLSVRNKSASCEILCDELSGCRPLRHLLQISK